MSAQRNIEGEGFNGAVAGSFCFNLHIPLGMKDSKLEFNQSIIARYQPLAQSSGGVVVKVHHSAHCAARRVGVIRRVR